MRVISNLRIAGAGALEIYENGTWYAICDNGWNAADAKVACTQLGYPLLGNLYHELDVVGEALYTNVDCVDFERRLDECAYEKVSGGSICTGAGVLCLNGKKTFVAIFEAARLATC